MMVSLRDTGCQAAPLRANLRRVLAFAVVSGSGLAIDTAIFFVLITLGWPSGAANICSAGVAVTFVYFTSVYRIFNYAGRFLLPLFVVYVVYHVMAVLTASAAIEFLARSGLHPLLAKLLILPITFAANYIAMRLITRSAR
jgi:putative flippase GtrA